MHIGLRTHRIAQGLYVSLQQRLARIGLTAALMTMSAFTIYPQALWALQAATLIPLTQDEAIGRLRDAALRRCAMAKTKYNLTPEKCQSLVNSRNATCAPSAKKQLLDAGNNVDRQKDAKRSFMECITPHYFCHGFEVKDVAEATKYCRS